MTHATEKIETRVDLAHGLEGFGLPDAENPTSDLLKSIAGLSQETTLKQVCGQSIELAAHLQSKQRLLDRRESELNAKLAMLETEERASRIRFNQDSSESAHETGVKSYERSAAKPLDCGIELEPSAVLPISSHDPTHRESAYFVNDDATIDFEPIEDGVDIFSAREPARDTRERANSNDSANPSTDHVRQSDLGSLQSALQERERRLVKREHETERLHNQVTALHRESLELRIATEQVWGELGNQLSDEQLAESISGYRSRLVDHFRMTSEEIARRSRELAQLQTSLREQESQIRRQRLDVQVWVDRQRDELESNTAHLSSREAEINQREIEFQRQAVTWQKQREEYRRQIEQLSRRVRQ